MSAPPRETFRIGRLDQAQLAALLLAPRAQAPFAILESLTDIDFPALDESIDLNKWPKGCIFGPAYELRWEAEQGAYRVWWAGSSGQPDGQLEHVFLEPDQGMEITENRFLMWGPGNLALARPPVYRCLPPGKGYPVLLCREFRRTDGSLAFYRFTGMQWEEAL